MSYYPPPRPYYQGYYTGADYGYGYHSNYGYGAPRAAGPPRGGWRGGARGRGGWTGGSSRGGAAGSPVVTVKTETPAPSSALKEVKTEPAEKTATPAATAKSGAVPNGGAAANGGGQTTPAAAMKPTGTTTAAAAKTTSVPTTTAGKPTTAAAKTTAAAGKTTTTATATAKTTVDTPLTEDHPFPESLTEKFFPNRCGLCSVVFPVARDIFIPEKGGMDYMSSNLQSTMHYSGKCHKKHLRQFMQDYCRRNRVRAPKKAWELMKDSPALPSSTAAQEAAKVDLYCKLCDLSFTSATHASQHYAGKNHQRKVEGKPPLRSGYYNARTGRWQRMPPGQEYERYPSRPPTFGVGGPRPAPAPTTTAAADPSVVTVQVAPGNLVNAGVKLTTSTTTAAPAAPTGTGAQSKFYCSICAVSATCQVQLDSHMTGTRHKMQAQKLGIPVPAAKPATSTAASPGTATASEPATKKPRRDYSIYKTPSGKFYCLPCNLTLNSETQFAQHFESKKHQAEVAKQRKAGVAV